MPKPRLFILFLFISIGVAFIFQYAVYGGKPSLVSGWAHENVTQIVLSNHVWELEFSEKMDEDTLTSDQIYVEDEKGNIVQTDITVHDDLHSVTITPPAEGYNTESKSYTLHIKKDITSLDGDPLKSGKKISFSISDGLPVVGSEAKLLGLFREVLNRERHFHREGLSMTEEESSAVAEDKSSASNEGSGTHSETNVQVQGVDEADVVKTDGTFIYQAIDRKLTITKAVPVDNIEVVSSITYTNFEPFQLFLDKDKLVVLGHAYSDYNEEVWKEKKMVPLYHKVQAIIYDISDQSQPKELKTVALEGSYVTSRKIGSTVYLLSNHYPDYWALEKEKVDLRPRYSDSAISDELQVIDYDDIHYFPDSEQVNYSIIAAFNIDHPEQEMKVTTYLGSGSDIYMSKENLYIAVAKYNDVLTDDRIAFDSFRPSTAMKTEVFKFAVSNLDVSFVASGIVKGKLLNQFSMDEFNGHFRIATTEGETWNETTPSSNHVFILNEGMSVVGSVEDLARGERIYSVRFMGEKAYVVTFKEVDPLFVLDVSNPSKPTVLGELKIPGFSNYLHPYDENHLIGFGQHTKLVKDQGSLSPRVMTDGVKISLFDVSNPLEPKEKFSEIIGGGGTYSPLNYDHKALLFNKEKNIFAFPITVYRDMKRSEYEQELVFHGAKAYSIDLENGFKLEKDITHETEKTIYETWENQIIRVLYIDDHIYAVSPNKITAHKVTW
ncbi:beta-propeller domain-containing protein [Bacillus sp. AK128]